MANETISFNDLVHFTDKQKEARKLTKNFKYIFYGGSAGPGKSYWLRWQLVDLLTDWAAKGFKGVRVGLFCEDYPSLRDRHISKIEWEFPAWLGTLNKADHEFTLSDEYGSGVICFRNLDDPSRYLSSEFAAVAVDEITQNDKLVFDFLRTRLRWPGIEDTKFMAASNPGGKGHTWVKDLWMNHKFEPTEREAHLFAYLRALPKDNPHLPQSYFAALEGLPEKLRKAYLEGNWDIFEGQFFLEWDAVQHICEPFKVPETWQRFRSIDPSGRIGVTSCHWYALDWNGRVYVYREYYATGKDSDQHADKIAELSEGESYKYSIIDASAFSKVGLPETQAEIYARHGITDLIASSKNRITGWDIVHQYLRWGDMMTMPDGKEVEREPQLKIFSTCVNLIRTLPAAIHDELHPEDIESVMVPWNGGKEHNDALDDLRYFLQTLRETKTAKPLNLIERRIKEMKDEEYFNFNYRKQ